MTHFKSVPMAPQKKGAKFFFWSKIGHSVLTKNKIYFHVTKPSVLSKFMVLNLTLIKEVFPSFKGSLQKKSVDFFGKKMG